MADPVFFTPPVPLTLQAIASLVGADLRLASDVNATVSSVAPIEHAAEGQLTFLENLAYLDHAATTRASACFVSPKYANRVTSGAAVLVVSQPYRAYAQVAAVLFPSSLRPQSVFDATGISPSALIHPTARIEAGAVIDPGVVIGPKAEIGAGTIIGANSVIGPDVRIGRNSAVGPSTTITHALIGNRVIIHQGARIGQDGFGFAMGPGGHLKMPQLGRVIVQDDVEIGANTTIDRGANRDTIIGEGSKIDNLVQIAHNVVIGRHCVIVAQVGIAGSTTLEDYVVLGGKVAVVGHITIGMGAQIAATSSVKDNVPRGARWGGTPAKPIKDWFREISTLKSLAKRGIGNTLEQKD